MPRLDSNGYAPSIMGTYADECYVCGRGGEMARHEVIYGTAYRQISKEHGLWIYVCPRCHDRIHRGDFPELKMMAQVLYERTHSRAEWMKLIGRNYRDND